MKPPGTRTVQCEKAPSGHFVVPCSEFAGKPADSSLTLVAAGEDSDGPPPLAESSDDDHQAAAAGPVRHPPKTVRCSYCNDRVPVAEAKACDICHLLLHRNCVRPHRRTIHNVGINEQDSSEDEMRLEPSCQLCREAESSSVSSPFSSAQSHDQAHFDKYQ